MALFRKFTGRGAPEIINDDDEVTLWTENNYKRVVPRRLIRNVRKMEILPGNYVHTKCASLMVLDNFIDWLKYSSVMTIDARVGDLLLLAEHYELPELVRAVLVHICSRFSFQTITPWINRLLKQRKLDQIQSHPEWWAKKLRVHALVGKREVTVKIPEDYYQGMIQLIILRQFIAGKGLDDFERLVFNLYGGKHRPSWALECKLPKRVHISYLLNYKRLFCDALKGLLSIPDVMAEDIYNICKPPQNTRFVSELHTLYQYFQDQATEANLEKHCDLLLKEIVLFTENSDWRNATQIPLKYYKFWKTFPDGNLLPEPLFAFVNRKSLLEKISIYLSKNPLSEVVQQFVKKYPDDVQYFLEEGKILNPFDLDILQHLTKLGSDFGYEEMYLEAYVAIHDLLILLPGHDEGRSEQTWERIYNLPSDSVSWMATLPLHGHYYTFDEVIEWKRDGDSGLIILVAENGARRKVHKTTLIEKSKFFEDFFANFPANSEIPCVFCLDEVVLDLWILFMLNDSMDAAAILSEVDYPGRHRIFLDLARIADYYMIAGMAVQNLAMVPDYSTHEYYFDFRNVPIYFLGEEERASWNDVCLILERRSFAVLYDSPHYLEMDIMEYLETLVRLDLPRQTCFKALELFITVNHSRLFETIRIDDGIFATGAYNPQFVLVRDILEEVSIYFYHSYPELDGIVQAMTGVTSKDSLLADISVLPDSENVWLPYQFQVYGEYDQYSRFSLPTIMDFRLLSERKLLLYNGSLQMIRDLDTGHTTTLDLPFWPSGLLFIWRGQLHAVVSENIWEFDVADYSWQKLHINDLGCLFSGQPIVVGDRLYFLPGKGDDTDNDWIRCIVSSGGDNYDSFFIEPTEDNREVLNLLQFDFRDSSAFTVYDSMHTFSSSISHEWPITAYSGLISPTGNEENQAFLFTKTEVLSVDRDTFRILERRSWPQLPRSGDFLTARFASDNLYIISDGIAEQNDSSCRPLSLYQLNFTSWEFVEVLVDKFTSTVPKHDLRLRLPLNPSFLFRKLVTHASLYLNILFRHNDDPSANLVISYPWRICQISMLDDKWSIFPTSYNDDPPLYMIQRNLVTLCNDSKVIKFWNLDDEKFLQDLTHPTSHPNLFIIGWNKDFLCFCPNSNKLWLYSALFGHIWVETDVDLSRCRNNFQSALTAPNRIYLVPVENPLIGDFITYLEKDYKGQFRIGYVQVTNSNKGLIDFVRGPPPICRFTELNKFSWGSGPLIPPGYNEQLYSGLISPFHEDNITAYLFCEAIVLKIYTYNLEIVGSRKWPILPQSDDDLIEGIFADKCFLLVYADPENGSAFVVYEFDFMAWEFVKVISAQDRYLEETVESDNVESPPLSSDYLDAMYS